MSLAIHAYLLDENPLGENAAFESVKKLFSKANGVKAIITNNPFTKKDYLKLKVDGLYSVSVFYDTAPIVGEDLYTISGEKSACNTRIRVLFGPDPDNEFDSIKIILLDYLQEMKNVLVYNANLDKIINNSSF